MSLKNFKKNGWIRPHTTSRQEIQDLLSIVTRDLQDAEVNEISADWRFGIAYNGALKLCTILLYTQGYRSGSGSHHMRTIATLPCIGDLRTQADADYLNTCRRKRNIIEYDYTGGVTDRDADELIAFTKALLEDLIHWLRSTYPGLA
ncbi:MAG: hypothetical protein JRJ68_14495 [Deltaproteobacteria bacterium]|nr:hypothetical protein [Deltaproteobacteria bacterium]